MSSTLHVHLLGAPLMSSALFSGPRFERVCCIVSLRFNVLNHADPNRPGMHMKLIKFLLKLKAPRIVYVSCNPATCARDLDYLCHGVVCVSFWPPLLSLSLSLYSHMMFWNCFAEREKYKRLLHAKETTTCRHVPTHSSYRVHLPAGALLIIPSCNHGFHFSVVCRHSFALVCYFILSYYYVIQIKFAILWPQLAIKGWWNSFLSY